MNAPTKKHLVSLSEAIELIQVGDILFFRGRTIPSVVIRMVGRGPYTHVGMADRRNGHIDLIEFREFRGGRVVNLATQIHKFSGRIDVYRPAASIAYYENLSDVESAQLGRKIGVRTYGYDGHKATSLLRDLAGQPYGWKRILRFALYFIPGIRWFVTPDSNDTDESHSYPVCSTSVSLAVRKGYVDPVPNLADFDTMPDDLARSALFSYLFTLVE